MSKIPVKMTVNGTAVEELVEPRMLLIHFLREKLGLTGDAATAYSKEVVAADFEEAGDQDVQNKVVKDFAAKGVAISAAEVRAKMTELMAEAAAQVKSGS